MSPISQGEAVFHESLSDPLIGEGLFCRKWDTQNNNTQSSFFARISNATITSQFNGSYAVSLRCAVRPTTASNGEAVTKAGLSAKGTAISTVINSGSYYFKVQNDTQFDLAGTIVDNPLGTTLYNKWTKMRLDVVPLKISGSVVADVLTAYVGSGNTGSESWTLVKQTTIEAGSANFIAWDTSNRFFGFGFYGDPTNSCVQTAYFDRFQVYTDPLS